MLRLNLIPNDETLTAQRGEVQRERKRAYMREYTARKKAEATPEEEAARREREREYNRLQARRYRAMQKVTLTETERETLRLRHREIASASYRKAVADPEKRRRIRAQSNASKTAARKRLNEQHKRKPCTDCGQRFPLCCMDFDHLDPTQKHPKARYRNLVMIGKDLLEAEIAKCELVCANCHRIRTSKRLGSPTAEPWWTE